MRFKKGVPLFCSVPSSRVLFIIIFGNGRLVLQPALRCQLRCTTRKRYARDAEWGGKGEDRRLSR